MGGFDELGAKADITDGEYDFWRQPSLKAVVANRWVCLD